LDKHDCIENMFDLALLQVTSRRTGRRTYTSPRRELQAAETRAAVLAAAGALFSEKGWAATGVRDVATAAGVSVETVYSNFGSKADLLLAALEVAVVGDPQPVALAERAEFTDLGVGTLAQRAAAAARLVTGAHVRTAGMYLALYEAAAADRGLAERMREGEQRRRVSLEQGMSLVAGRPVTPRERDGLWAIAGVEVYRLLTEISGWTRKEYQTWLAGVFARLLGPGGVSAAPIETH
jgi:AcrR family transcriptional regulator